MKHVTTLVRRPPERGGEVAEALRVSLGLTLTDNRVTLVLVGEAVRILAPEAGPPERSAMERHLRTLRELRCRVVAEAEAVEKCGLGGTGLAAELMPRRDLQELLCRSSLVIGF